MTENIDQSQNVDAVKLLSALTNWRELMQDAAGRIVEAYKRMYTNEAYFRVYLAAQSNMPFVCLGNVLLACSNARTDEDIMLDMETQTSGGTRGRQLLRTKEIAGQHVYEQVSARNVGFRPEHVDDHSQLAVALLFQPPSDDAWQLFVAGRSDAPAARYNAERKRMTVQRAVIRTAHREIATEYAKSYLYIKFDIPTDESESLAACIAYMYAKHYDLGIREYPLPSCNAVLRGTNLADGLQRLNMMASAYRWMAAKTDRWFTALAATG